jgi:hypothetical protein
MCRIQFIAANDKLMFWMEIHSLVDYFTIPPIFVSIALGRQWIGMNYVLVLCNNAPSVLPQTQLFAIVLTLHPLQLSMLLYADVRYAFPASAASHHLS